jgi:hypothetical protein
VKSAGSAFVAILLLMQLGSGTPLGQSLDQIGRSVTRPVPQAPPTSVWRPDSVWLPDRHMRDPIDGRTIIVPGHWERRLPDGQYYGPPMTICSEAGGTCTTIPAGVRPAPENRQTP